MQVADDCKDLSLSIDFKPSLALYIWQSFGKGLRKFVQSESDVLRAWIWSAQACCTQGFIAASMADMSSLPVLLAVNPSQTFPDDGLLNHSLTNSSHSLILTHAEPLVQLLLLFAQLLTTVAVDRSSILVDSAEAEEGLCSAVVSRLEQLTDISSCVPVLLNTTPADQPGSPEPRALPSRHVILLRSLVLFLKLATLTFSVKADHHPGQVDSELHHSIAALWRVIFETAGDFLDEPYPSNAKGDGTQTCTYYGNEEEQSLCVVLCEHAAVTLRQALKEPWADKPRRAILRVLTAVLNGMNPELMTQQIQRLGTR